MLQHTLQPNPLMLSLPLLLDLIDLSLQTKQLPYPGTLLQQPAYYIRTLKQVLSVRNQEHAREIQQNDTRNRPKI